MYPRENEENNFTLIVNEGYFPGVNRNAEGTGSFINLWLSSG